jgi:hypothetical protein
MPVFYNEAVHDEMKVVHFRVLWLDLVLVTLHLNSSKTAQFNCLELEINGKETVMAYRPTILSVGRTQKINKRSQIDI